MTSSSRLFRLLDPAAFEAGFARFVAAFSARIAPGASPQVVAVDGKTARRSFDRLHGQRPLHLISAWAVEQRLVLGQRKVDAASNETRALPELLALLDAGRPDRHRRCHARPQGHGAGDPRPRW